MEDEAATANHVPSLVEISCTYTPPHVLCHDRSAIYLGLGSERSGSNMQQFVLVPSGGANGLQAMLRDKCDRASDPMAIADSLRERDRWAIQPALKSLSAAESAAMRNLIEFIRSASFRRSTDEEGRITTA